MKSFLDGAMRGAGLILAPALMAIAIWYRQQHLSVGQNAAVLGIFVLLLFVIIGYSVFHRLLWARFSRATLFCFVSWVAVIVMGRIYDFFYYIPQDSLRWIYTGTAAFFSLNLLFFVWMRPWAVSLLRYLYGPEILQPSKGEVGPTGETGPTGATGHLTIDIHEQKDQ